MPRFAARAFHRLSVFAILVLTSSAPLAATDSTPLSTSQARILEEARSYVFDYTRNLPNFICTQVTNRTVITSPEDDSAGPPPSNITALTTAGINSQRPSQSTLVSEGSIEEKLTYINWEEHYEVIAINGRKATAADPKRVGGAVSGGEFGTLLSAIFEPQAHTVFTCERMARLRGRNVHIFAFQVPKESGMPVSHLNPDAEVVAAYTGEVFVDAETGQVLRVTSHVIGLPPDFPVKLVERSVDYTPVSIEGKIYNLPSHSELQMRDSERLYVNKINFKDYHKFTVESTIRTGSFAGSSQPAGAPGSGNAAANPGGAEQAAESAQPQPPPPVSDERSASQNVPPQSPSSAMVPQVTPMRNPASPVDGEQPASPAPAAIQPPPSPGSTPAPVPALASVGAPAPLPGNALNSPYSLKIGVDLVMVPVVVRDRSGRAVGNLTRDDFEIFDKGKREPISAFNVESLSAEAGSARLSSSAASQMAPNAGSRPNFIVYLFDDMHLKFADLANVREAAARQIEALTPSDLAAILTTSGTVSSPFTTDHALLKQTLLKLRAGPPEGSPLAPPCPHLSYYEADQMLMLSPELVGNPPLQLAYAEILDCQHSANSDPDLIIQSALEAARAVKHSGDLENRSTLLAVRDVVRWLAKAPGSRNLVLVSPGFIVSSDNRFDESNVIEEAIRDQVVINALDARGLNIVALAGGAAADRSVFAGPMNLNSNLGREEALQSSAAMEEITAGTGGAFVHNSNDFDGGFARLAASPAFVYLLGFKPAKLDGNFHPLKVKLTSENGKLDLQARLGYIAAKH
jgi:VWFA-related protein